MSNAPWTIDPFALGAPDLAVIRCKDAAPAIDIGDHVARALAHRVIAAVGPEPFAKLVALAHNIGNLDAITGPQLDALVAELDQLGELLSVEVGAVAAGDMVRVEIIATTKTPRGRTTIRHLGWTACGDGDIVTAQANAQQIAASLSNARMAVAAARERLQTVRGIASENIVIDLADAKWFDARSWQVVTVPPHLYEPQPRFDHDEIVERKTGKRLADLLVGTDGLWDRAGTVTLVIDGKTYLDFRRHRLAVDDGSYALPGFRLPPGVIDKLKAINPDLGKAVASLVAK